MLRSWSERALLLAVLLGPAACASRDPFLRDDVWKPTGANAGNLAAMVANPHDLISGRGTMRSDTKATTAAIGNIWSGQPKSLRYGNAGGDAGGEGSGATGGAATGSSPTGS